jgi:hypothetical protein
MWVPVDGPGRHRVTLVYRRGPAEQLGELITIATLLLLALGAVGLRVPAEIRRRSQLLYGRLRVLFTARP